MYVLTKIRGCGIGQKLMDCCLDAARSFGFKKCYLETIPALHSAVDLYRRNDFLELQAPLGATGHHNCGVVDDKRFAMKISLLKKRFLDELHVYPFLRTFGLLSALMCGIPKLKTTSNCSKL